MNENDIAYFGVAKLPTRNCVFWQAGQNKRRHPLPLRLDLLNHSPTGFGWGYGGSGPAQLALAILAHATEDDALAVALHLAFKDDTVARLRMTFDWTISKAEVLQWIRSAQAEEAA